MTHQLFDLWNDCLLNLPTAAHATDLPVSHTQPGVPVKLDSCIVWADFETNSLDARTGAFVLGWLYVWPLNGEPYWVYLSSHLAAGTTQVATDQQVSINLHLTNCIVVAFNIGFERSWLEDRHNPTNFWMDLRSLIVRCEEVPTGLNSLADYVGYYLNQHLDKTDREAVVRQDAEILSLAKYCRKDVEVMLDLWSIFKASYFEKTHQTNRTGQLLASSLTVTLKGWPQWLEQQEASCQEQVDVVGQKLAEKVQAMKLASPSWFSNAPRKKAEKAGWLKSLADEWTTDIEAVLGVVGVTDSVMAAKFRKSVAVLESWEPGQELSGLGTSAVVRLVGASWLNSETGVSSKLAKDNDGWFYQVGRHRAEVLNQKATPIKGNTVFTKDVILYQEAADDKPALSGVVCDLPELQRYLTQTAFYRSIQTRAQKLAYEELPDYPGYHVHCPNPTVNGTFTGRSIDPFWLVLANPKPKKLASDIKLCLAAKPGHKLVRLDFSSQELRLAHYVNSKYGADHWGWANNYNNNPFADAEVNGVKEDGTDSHSVFAKMLGVNRDLAKQVSYCVPTSTEALVLGRGWVNRAGLNVGDLILTHNTATGYNEYQPVLALNDFEQQPTLRMWNAKGWDVTTTANHRWFGDRFNTPAWFTSGDYHKEHRILQAAPLKQRSMEVSSMGHVNKYDRDADWVGLVSAMAEGELWAFYNSAIAFDGSVSPRQYNLPGFFDAVVLAGYLLGFNVFIGNLSPERHANMQYAKFGRVATRVMVSMKTEGAKTQDVWCPTTVNGTWVMRQGNTITITGNSLQFGGGNSTLVQNSGLSPELAERTLVAYKGQTVHEENFLGEPVKRFYGGVLSGYANYCLDITEASLKTQLFGGRPRNTLQPVGRLTLNNFPIQGTGVDMRDLLLTEVWHRTGQQLAMVLHDEQVWEVANDKVDWFCEQVTIAHALVWQTLHAKLFGTAVGCPKNHYILDGIEVYEHWRKEVHMAIKTPNRHQILNWDEGYVWKPSDKLVASLG